MRATTTLKNPRVIMVEHMTRAKKAIMHKVIIYPGEDGYWVAECPSLPGCVSQGKTKSEAKANIREAIEGYEAALEDIESNPGFLKMMKQTEADIRAGRVFTQEEVERLVRQRRKGR
jgi:predicted RNase H-like HicB family nuclease